MRKNVVMVSECKEKGWRRDGLARATDGTVQVFANRDRSRSKLHGWRSPLYRYADVVKFRGTETRARGRGEVVRERCVQVRVCVYVYVSDTKTDRW